MDGSLLLFVSSFSALAAVCFAAIAVLWLRRLRDGVFRSVEEATAQQLSSLNRLHEEIGRMQKQQKLQEQQVQSLVGSNLKLRIDMVAMASRLDMAEEDRAQGCESRTVH